MTLFDLMSIRWRKAAPAPELQPAVVPVPATKLRVPAEYLSLHTYLERRYASMVVLTFDQMESLLGFALPEAARLDREWWTGAALRTVRYSDSWIAARRTAAPNLPAGTVAFERIS